MKIFKNIFIFVENMPPAILNLITIASLILSIYLHSIYIKEFNDTKNQIKNLTESVQTHKIDDFPNNRQQVTDLINSAKHSLEIYCDLSCWGMYSTPFFFENEYSQALLGKKIIATRGNMVVHIYTYNEEYTQDVMNKFFNHKNTTIEKIKESSYAQFLKEKYPHKYDKFKNIETIEEFTKYMTDEEKAFKDELNYNNSCETYENKKMGAEIPYFMWIKDDKEAIIDLPYYIGEGKEFSIQTSDKYLIETFKNFLEEQIKGKLQ